jgi:hypothetical protein
VVACTCGYEASAAARFCGGCGCPIEIADLPPLGLAEIESEADFGAEADSEILTEQAVTKNGPSPRRWMTVAGVVGGGLAAWLVWSLATGSGSAPEAASDEPSPTTVAAPTTSTTESSSTTTTPAPVPVVIETVGVPAPILGEELGYDLIIGTNGRPAVLNLDSGEIRYAQGGRTVPLAVSGDWLIVQGSDRPHVLPLDDLGADLADLPFSPEVWVESVDDRQRHDGRARFALSESSGLPRLALVDLARNEIIEETAYYPDSVHYLTQTQVSLTDGSRLISPISGGVYEERGNDFLLVADGRLIVADEHRALVETCDDRLRCSMHWLDRETWQPADLAVPADPFDLAILANGTDWLVTISHGPGPGPNHNLLNIVTGQQVEIPIGLSAFNNLDHSLAISPDGRWLALASTGEVKLLDLESGEEIVVDGLRDVAGPVLFIERSVQ